MATINYKCPNCGGPLKFNPDKQKFSCEYCMSDFDEKTIQDLYAEQEAKESRADREEQRAKEKAEKTSGQENTASEEDAFVYTCPSCGAEVVTTASTAATTCFYCQNPVVLGGRLSGEFKPDRVVPFALSKDSATKKFMEMCGKKWFLPKNFASEKQFDKFNGVYFPYWYVDEQKQASMVAKGEKIRTWTVGRKHYTETSTYRLYRTGDLVIKNVFERALKNNDREMLQCVHPFDLTKAQDFAMSYLSGFQAEKRDLEKTDVSQEVEQRIQEYAKDLLQETMSEYTAIRTENYNDKTELESWNYTLLPVWITTYKYGDKIFPYAINGQTGKTFGKLPVSKGKLALLFAIVTVAVFILGVLGGMLFL